MLGMLQGCKILRVFKFSENFVQLRLKSQRNIVSTLPLKSLKVIIIVEKFATGKKIEDFACAKSLEVVLQ